MKLKIVLDIETDSYFDKEYHQWLLNTDEVAATIHEAFGFYKNDFVFVTLEEKKSEEAPAYRRQVDYVAEKQKRLLKINPPDDPYTSIGYTKK